MLDNDEQVLDEILRTIGPVVLAILTRRYPNFLREPDIEDVMSIGLFRLWKNREKFDCGKASLKVWFFRIVENAARDVLRHDWHKARLLEVDGDAGLMGLADVSCNSQAEISKHVSFANSSDPAAGTLSDQQVDLRETVAALSEQQRFIVLAEASAKDGVTSSQLSGDELGIPASSVRVHRKRAMDRIRTELKKRGHDVPER